MAGNLHEAPPGSPGYLQNCLEGKTHLTADIAAGEFKLYKCKNNLWHVATPILVGERHLGNLLSGQFFLEGEPVDYEFSGHKPSNAVSMTWNTLPLLKLRLD